MVKQIKEIIRPSFRLVRNLEHYDYHTSVLSIVSPLIAKTYSMEDQRWAYEKLFKKESESINRKRSFEETKDIQAAARKREEVFMFIKRFIENMTRNPDPAFKNAAVILDNAIEPYRNVTRKSFKDSSKLIEKFIRETENTEPLFNAISLLDLFRPVELLKASNDSFQSLYNERSAKKHQRSTTTKLKELRPEVDKAFFEVAKFINAVYLVSVAITNEKKITDELGAVIDKINARTSDLFNSIDLRRSKNEQDEHDL
jgi:hypothetical protein